MSRVARLAFLTFALALALIVSLMSYRMMSQQPVIVEKSPKVKAQQIAVAAADIPRGHKLAQGDIRYTNFLADTCPVGAFSPEQAPVGRVAMTAIKATVPILDSQLASKNITQGGLASIVSSNKRAMSVSVDKVIGVAGFVHPGHMVDVLVSIKSEQEKEGYITKTVLENILILAVGTQAQESGEKKATKVNVVTLEVTPDESESLALAVNKGNISLALRGYSDKEVVYTRGATVPELLDKYRTEEPVVVAMAIPSQQSKPLAVKRLAPIKKILIEVINGSDFYSGTTSERR